MEKLIELLNEYEGKVYKYSKISNLFHRGEYDSYEEVTEEKLISKKYGFIKRLLDNNKININEGWDDYEKTNLYCNSDFFQLQKHYSYYESLLMLLAISDNPIDLLCERLK